MRTPGVACLGPPVNGDRRATNRERAAPGALSEPPRLLHNAAMSVKSFSIPDDLRAFLRDAAERLDEPDTALDGEDALQCACAYGGREAETGRFVFVCVAPDGGTRRLLRLTEPQLRAAGRAARPTGRDESHRPGDCQ